jgi:hypothetical protein
LVVIVLTAHTDITANFYRNVPFLYGVCPSNYKGMPKEKKTIKPLFLDDVIDTLKVSNYLKPK